MTKEEFIKVARMLPQSENFKAVRKGGPRQIKEMLSLDKNLSDEDKLIVDNATDVFFIQEGYLITAYIPIDKDYSSIKKIVKFSRETEIITFEEFRKILEKVISAQRDEEKTRLNIYNKKIKILTSRKKIYDKLFVK